MVIGAFPVAKLGLLFVKQISKPIANVIKNNAKQSPVFRKYVCMPPAQFYNWVEVKTKMWALNLGRPVKVPPLNEAMAIELGANLLGEAIIFVFGAGILVFEYVRQSNNEYNKQEATKQEKLELVNTLAEMGFRLERQDAQIREMTRSLADLDSRSLFRWNRDQRLTEYKQFDPSNPDQSPSKNENYKGGVYNPNRNVLFRALNFLEKRIFTNVTELNEQTESQAVLNVETEIAKLNYALQLESQRSD